MNATPGNINQAAFGKSADEPLTREEQEICEEWASGKGAEMMKIDIEDPEMLTHLGLYEKLKNRSEEVWESMKAAQSIVAAQPSSAPIITINQQPSKIRKRTWLAAAATVALVIGGYALFNYFQQHGNNEPGNGQIVTNQPTTTIPNRATLTLANNVQIDLEAVPAGVIAQQNGMEISKTAGNQLVYRHTAGTASTATATHRLTIPYGHECQVMLSDGSTVWLNAGSTLDYPASFTGDDRLVKMTGEGYFEVAENKAKPFRVLAAGTEIKVLGTQFNVKAYAADNAVTTTLVKGAVAIQQGANQQQLKPNQQAVVTGEGIRVKNSSQQQVNQTLAWKNGLINLEGESVRSILQQIQHWYNVETQVAPGTPETTMTGTIEKTTSLTNVLELLNTNLTVQFSLQGEKLIASKK